MRIKKPQDKTNQDITFDTITDRNEAIKTLVDGDLVKVSDASDDPNISSGWAVYRFSFETQTFDLIEKEEKDPKTPAPNPDGATVERFTSDDKLRVIDGLQSTPHDATINEDFNLRVVWKSYIKQIKFITDNNEYLNVPCTQGAIEKTMAINGLNQTIKNWGSKLFNSVYYGAYVSKMVTDGTRHVRMIHGLGKFPTLNLTEDEVLVAMVRLEVPESFEAVDPTKLTFFRLWKKGLKAIKPSVPEIETPDLQAVTDKGSKTTNSMTIRRNGKNSNGHTIEDETGSTKHAQNILDYAGHYQLAGKDKSIGISLNGEGVADFKKSVSTAALKVKTGAATGKIAVCQDAAGNVVWQDMPSFTALRGMSPDYLILQDFDFDIQVSGLTVKFIPRGLDGAKRFIEVSGPMGASMRTNRFFQLNKVEKTLDFSAGKPLYFYSSSQCNLSKTIPPTTMGAQNNFSDWTKQPTIRIIENSAKIFAVRVNPPSDGKNLKTKDVTIYKIWKNHLAPFDELMDYRVANP